MYKKFALLALLLTLVWVTSACAGGGGDGSGSIQDISWQWESVTAKSTGETTIVQRHLFPSRRFPHHAGPLHDGLLRG
jgi:hypothetical protein